ncbi:MAG: hydroxymethylbilane synthase [Rhizobiaceae bacterium]|nr:hydroxymethylbilane synthase [Rhizobiaceae bacterium]
MSKFLIATRKSKMALAQTKLVSNLLQQAVPGLDVDLAQSNPRGDRDQISRLDRHGGKGGAFVAEIRADVVAGRSQCAMHSLKDMPGNEETPGLVIGAYLRRDDPSDSLALRPGLEMAELRKNGGEGFKIGTNSVRRAAFLHSLFPNAEVIHFRGAADTRIDKLDNGIPQKMVDGSEVGPADAILLATSGMARVGLSNRVAYTFTSEEMLPAVGQGIVAVECASTDWQTREYLARIDDADARCCAEAEREVLWVLDGHCNSPIAALSKIDGDTMSISAAVMSLDGETILRAQEDGPGDYPRELGRKVAMALIAQGAQALVEATRI